MILDFFPPNVILKLFCIFSTFTCFPALKISVLFTTVVAFDGTIVFVAGLVGEAVGIFVGEGVRNVVEGWVLGCIVGLGHMGTTEQTDW